MSFITVPGLKGKLYLPEKAPAGEKKHACPDCFACQACGEARCHVCRGEKKEQNISIQDKVGGKA